MNQVSNQQVDSKIPTVCMSRSADPIIIDDINDYYTNLQYLAKGTYGVVYKATDKATGETVALKQMIDTLDTKNVIKSIQKEFRELNKLIKNGQCPEFLACYRCLYQTPTDLILVMDYVEGKEFGSWFEGFKKTNNPRLLRSVILQLLMALEELQEAELLHIDINIGNIMIHRGGDAKLIDYGALCSYYDCEFLSTFPAPEQYLINSYVATHKKPFKSLSKDLFSKMDIFSLGATLFWAMDDNGNNPWNISSSEKYITYREADMLYDPKNPLKWEAAPFKYYRDPCVEKMVNAMLIANPALRPSTRDLITILATCPLPKK